LQPRPHLSSDKRAIDQQAFGSGGSKGEATIPLLVLATHARGWNGK